MHLAPTRAPVRGNGASQCAAAPGPPSYTRRVRRLLLLTVVAVLAVIAAACTGDSATPTTAAGGVDPAASAAPATPAGDPPPATAAPPATTTPAATTSTVPATTTTTTTLPPVRFSDRRFVRAPHGSVAGITMFRGNPTRTWYGTGPLPPDPVRLWRYPDAAMCGSSTLGGEARTWCGTGWTGQPVVWERPDGVTEVIFNSYDKSVHFVDAATGEPTRTPFRTGDIVKGSVAIDPDGYPLLFFGSRDNLYRIVALDRDPPALLWSRNANESPAVWNNDWDGNPAIVDDIMFLGGENSWFYAFRLNRAYAADGLVTVDPELLIEFPAFTDELLAAVGREQSIENSVAVYEGRVYFANSAGRVVGLDVTGVDEGEAPVVFDFWTGEDVDASIVVDADGMLYVAAEQERFNARGREVGQLVKLDPYTAGDPIVWSVAVPPRGGGDGGLWATPALGAGMLYAPTHTGELLAVDTATGEVMWRDEIGFHAWSSPAIVDDTLVVAVDCGAGGALRGYDLADPRRPVQVWQTERVGGCIESTPAVWDGRMYVGSRDGFFYAFGPAP